MASNAKRLRALARQRRVAAIARREAIASLAEANASEAQSASLATRCRNMARDYGQRGSVSSGGHVTQLGAFAGSLAGIAREAEQSRSQAAQQRDVAVQGLAASEQRLERLDERLAAEKREHNRTKQQRDYTQTAVLAHKLLRSQTDDQPQT